MSIGKSALCATLAAAFAAPVFAANPSAYVVTADRGPAEAKSQVQTYVRIFPSASGPLTAAPDSGDRILPHLAKVQYARSFNTYVNPYQDLDYNRPTGVGIDENHSLKRAQRMHLAMTTGSGATTLINERVQGDERSLAGDIQPRAIIHIPRKFRDNGDQRQREESQEKPRRIASSE